MSRIIGGVSYYPDHWPTEEWEKDMRQGKCMRRLVLIAKYAIGL
jgi:beta-galactosidase GanA